MIVGGIQWTSMVDFPGHIAVSLFTLGCNYRCPFCHNPELVLASNQRSRTSITESWILAELEERVGFYDAVVISGGEPTLHDDLAEFFSELRRMGYATKLDTNGSRPEVVAALLDRGLVDFVAMDIKAPRNRYAALAGVEVDLDSVEQTMHLLKERAPDYEFRTTVAPTLTADDLLSIGQWIRGAKQYFLQLFHAGPDKPLLDPAWQAKPALEKEALEAVWEQLRAMGLREGGVRA